jgi:hypothetical protein
MMKDMFEVVEVSEIGNERYSAVGRCLETIKLGETLYSAVGRKYRLVNEGEKVYSVLIEPDLIPEVHPFVVIAISAYGKDLDILEGGLTGRLILDSTHMFALKNTNYLVHLEQI